MKKQKTLSKMIKLLKKLILPRKPYPETVFRKRGR